MFVLVTKDFLTRDDDDDDYDDDVQLGCTEHRKVWTLCSSF